MHYKPGKWAMASTAIMAFGWLVNIWVANKDGVDTSLIGIPSFIGILFCGILPMICGAVAFRRGRRSQRTADIAFAICMIAQGIALAIIPTV